IVSLPAFFHHEWLATPFAELAGLMGGLIRDGVSHKEGHLGFRALYVFEFAEMARAHDAGLRRRMGGAAASRLRRAGSGTTAARPRYTAPPLALLYRCAQLVVRAAADAGDPNGSGGAYQD